jgi:sulfate adenylyltransferase
MGGKLVNLVIEEEKHARLVEYANTLSSIQLTARSLCDIELLATGAFAPLEGFMSRADYNRVLEEMRLSDGTLFPIPITLPVTDLRAVRLGKEIALQSPKNELIAIMTVEEIFDWGSYERSEPGVCDDRSAPSAGG